MSGIDCAGLVYCVGRDLGLNVQILESYSRYPDGSTLLRAARRELILQSRPPQEGDVLIMWFNESKRPTHLGIVGTHPTHPDQLSLIHTYTTVGKVVEHILSPDWVKRISAVCTYPEA